MTDPTRPPTDPVPATPAALPGGSSELSPTIAEDHALAANERSKLVYIGHALPWPVVLLWAAFLSFGLIYFLVHL
ncbi:MAG: hypothetical protein FJ293_11210 [Planctomycetes bacterium]|nr:hypothetical protein [Planctomycetota bacterium]